MLITKNKFYEAKVFFLLNPESYWTMLVIVLTLLLSIERFSPPIHNGVFSIFVTKDSVLLHWNNELIYWNYKARRTHFFWLAVIEKSRKRLKPTLSHNRNKFPTLHLAHFVMRKENYNSVKMELETWKWSNENVFTNMWWNLNEVVKGSIMRTWWDILCSP